MYWYRLIIVSAMTWPHCENLMSCPHEYLFTPHPPNQLFSFYTDLLPPPLLVPSCLLPTWWPPPTSHPPPLLWACMSGFFSLAHIWLRWPPPRCLYKYWLGGGWFCYLGPLAHLRLHCPTIYVCTDGGGGGGVDTWSPLCTPDFYVYVRPGGYWIEIVTRTLLIYVDNLSLVLVMEE